MPLSNTPSRAACFAAVYALLRSSADAADRWVQTDHQADTNGQRDGFPGRSARPSRRACATHCCSLGLEGQVDAEDTRFSQLSGMNRPLPGARQVSWTAEA